MNIRYNVNDTMFTYDDRHVFSLEWWKISKVT